MLHPSTHIFFNSSPQSSNPQSSSNKSLHNFKILNLFSTVFMSFSPKQAGTVITIVVALFAVYWNWKSNSSTKDNLLNSDFTRSDEDEMASNGPSSIYDFKYIDIDGVEQSMEKYRGHVLIIVNVASKCGFTCVNYKQMTELYERYGESHGLRILAFPCNQFNGQEPLTEKEIKEFAEEYNVRYDMASKIKVNGDETHPLWGFLKEKQRGILGTTSVKWNFTKFLVDKQGNVIKRYSPNTNPREMENDILDSFNKS